jgi:hypothetical protein
MLEKYNQRVLESNRFNDKNNFITLIVILFVEIICVETKQHFATVKLKLSLLFHIIQHLFLYLEENPSVSLGSAV